MLNVADKNKRSRDVDRSQCETRGCRVPQLREVPNIAKRIKLKAMAHKKT